MLCCKLDNVNVYLFPTTLLAPFTVFDKSADVRFLVTFFQSGTAPSIFIVKSVTANVFDVDAL